MLILLLSWVFMLFFTVLSGRTTAIAAGRKSDCSIYEKQVALIELRCDKPADGFKMKAQN